MATANDQNVLPNDVGADTTGDSDVFSNVLSSAGGAAAAIINAINQPQIQAQNKAADANKTNNMLLLAGVVLAIVVIWHYS